MQKEYVTRVEDVYWVGKTRVLFREGMSAESMVE